MISTRVTTQSTRAAAQILKSNVGLRPTFVAVQLGCRSFSSSNSPKIKEFFEQKQTEKVRKTPAAWQHPGMSVWRMKARLYADSIQPIPNSR